MTRILGDPAALSSTSVHAFFEKRASGATIEDHLAVTSFAARAEADERHLAEAQQILPLLLAGRRSHRWLEIGCGGGRWAVTLLKGHALSVQAYHGVDFSASLIKLARELDVGPAARFHEMAAENLDVEALSAGGRFSRILVTALCLYMNDDAVAHMLSAIARLSEPGALFYLREPMSMTGKRLTLINEYSSALGAEYNAVYRTPPEYETLISDSAAFDAIGGGAMMDERFRRQADTPHRYMLIRRK